jgi:nucleoside-diphosphate-sugar epimerase
MRLLVTGNMGYVGPVLIEHLRRTLPDATLVAYDSGWFAHCIHPSRRFPETRVDVQHFGDVRRFDPHVLEGVDAIAHLAAVSNDPMGNRFAAVTAAINHESTVALARMAAERGVRRFVFASSCSMYGVADGGPRTERDELNPLTAYARSKVAAERDLEPLADTGMAITCLRFATACGMSDRLRLDLVLNDFVAGAVAAGEISVLSDGSPWRPLIDVKDMARAIEWGLQRDANRGGAFLAVNAGCDAGNYQVRQLAETVAALIPGTRVSINSAAPADSRSYRVDFGRYRELAPDHQPQVGLEQSVQELKAGLESMRFADRDFRSSAFMRIRVLESHITAGRLSPDLWWL